MTANILLVKVSAHTCVYVRMQITIFVSDCSVLHHKTVSLLLQWAYWIVRDLFRSESFSHIVNAPPPPGSQILGLDLVQVKQYILMNILAIIQTCFVIGFPSLCSSCRIVAPLIAQLLLFANVTASTQMHHSVTIIRLAGFILHCMQMQTHNYPELLLTTFGFPQLLLMSHRNEVWYHVDWDGLVSP